ncbi:MAG: valine--tRNA ligase [Pirellulales bacterium]|nr:valine--tRNA ligase [Pirellulales bacterium]
MSSPTQELPKQYDPGPVQRRWIRVWEDRGYGHAEPDLAGDPQRSRAFCVVIPPPNVTGALHLGHALNNTLQDILVRRRRMQGYHALWMPGTDHAGIATQAVVERRLLTEENKTRHDLGREALVARIWKWKHDYEARILEQLKQMGCSCDWERTRFTLDETCARAVRHTFFRMFSRRLIYRGQRMVNWDTFLQTAVSDDEVFHETVKGHFWQLRYPVVDPQPGEPTHVTIATTRPETMLGDTAVAVHPDPAGALDQAEAELREKHAAAPAKQQPEIEREIEALRQRRTEMLPLLVRLRDMARAGRKVRLPLMNREIPLVADVWAKPELGTGAVKITPAHDPNDYEVGLRQKLPMLNILTLDGRMNDRCGAYSGLTIKQAREKVVADLQAQGLLGDVEDREIDLAHSDRSKTPIEPLLTDQWFVKMEQLAQSAMDAVSDGRVQITPARYAKGYLDWLSEKRDWPVSRQLWWGHRIPIWYAPAATEADLQRAFAGRDDVSWYYDADYGHWLICSRDDDLAEDAIPGQQIKQDPDVLDTWFSSALWPHSTLGWPESTPELAYFYPTSVLVTSRDIITLWVARMVLTGLLNVGDVPFRRVYIHPKILDGYGETMSKSKGNGVDPLDVIEKFGADALRFGLAYLATETQDVRMPVEFECPHCQAGIEQTKKTRVLARVECPKCGRPFSTQWATKPEDVDLPRAAVISERFELARNFCNKLWNASRFALLNLEGYAAAEVRDAELAVEDRWILSRLATVTQRVDEAIEQFRFADAARELYDFAWDEFCSYYVEMIKARLQAPASRAVAQRVLAHTLDTLLRLLHPLVPFITEEIWSLLGEAAPRRGLSASAEPAAASIMVAPWPAADLRRRDEAIEVQFARFTQALTGLRDVRARQNIAPKKPIEFVARTDAATTALLEPMAAYFAALAGATARAWGPDATIPSPSAHFAIAGGEIHVDLAEFIDIPAEIARNEKELEKLQGLLANKEKKLSNEAFVSRAPAEVVAQERASLEETRQRIAAMQATLADLRRRA